MPAQALIINADDLGLWPTVDAGIFLAWRDRAISGATALATCAYLESLVEKANRVKLPIGVQLNLTSGKPLSNPLDIPALVTEDGEFMKRQLWTRPLPQAQVRQELSMQIERLMALGVTPTHLSSNRHIHGYPDIFPVVVDLAMKYHLPVRAMESVMQDELRSLSIPCPDHFDMSFFGEDATVATLIKIYESVEAGVLEIMSHPGHTGPDLPSSYGEYREQELAALIDPLWVEYQEEHNVKIIGYSELR